MRFFFFIKAVWATEIYVSIIFFIFFIINDSNSRLKIIYTGAPPRSLFAIVSRGTTLRSGEERVHYFLRKHSFFS